MQTRKIKAGLALALGAAAIPAETAKDSGEAPGARIPCYTLEIDNGGFNRGVRVTNNCGSTKRVRAIVDWWSDGPCWTIRNGERKAYYYKTPGEFLNLHAC